MKSHPIFVALAALAGACVEPAAELAAPPTLRSPDVRASILVPHDGTPVMTKLRSPRGLAWAPDGSLYVAEAGRGGPLDPAHPERCFVDGTATFCLGNTGGVSRLRNGVQERVIDDLPSYAQVKSGQGEGPNGISFHGFGGAYVTIGLEANPATLRAKASEWSQMGRLVHIEPAALAPGRGAAHSGQSWEFVADLGQYEMDVNPDCGDIDSNPFGVLADAGGVIVMDAGANAMVWRDANGELSTLAAFSNNTTVSVSGKVCPAPASRDFVPTAITIGPDGAYYFGHLNGLKVLPGSSKVWRLERGGTPTVFLENFTWIVALAFDPSGNLYVQQFTDGSMGNANGFLTRVAPDGTRQTVVSGLQRAAGMTVGPDGAVYISMTEGMNYTGPGEVRRYVIP